MVSLWYYAHDGKKLGPFSQQALKEMAAAGTVRPMDMVWREGVEQGALANQIKNLFPPAVMNSTDAIDEALRGSATPPAESPEIVVNEALVPLPTPEPPKAQPKAPERPAKKARALAIKGCDIVSQDGSYARYRKKCLRCGEKDASCRTIPILNKTIKDHFFCPKCRKRSEVAIQCQA